jgi:hypothetical protein
MFEDFKDHVKEHEATEAERNLVKNALGENLGKTQKLKKFGFLNDEKLTFQIFQLYPEATQLVIVNNDIRDGEGIPTIRTRQLREITKTYTTSRGQKVLSRVDVPSDFIILCLIEYGQVNVKIIVKQRGITP